MTDYQGPFSAWKLDKNRYHIEAYRRVGNTSLCEVVPCGEVVAMLNELHALKARTCESCQHVGRNDFGKPHVYVSMSGERMYGCGRWDAHHHVPAVGHSCSAHAPKEAR